MIVARKAGRVRPRERLHLQIADKLSLADTTYQAPPVFSIFITHFTTHRSKVVNFFQPPFPALSRNSCESSPKASSRSEAKLCPDTSPTTGKISRCVILKTHDRLERVWSYGLESRPRHRGMGRGDRGIFRAYAYIGSSANIGGKRWLTDGRIAVQPASAGGCWWNIHQRLFVADTVTMRR